MASISNDPNGRRRILFIGPDGRKAIRLGKCSERQAEAVKVKVEDLVSAIITGHTPSDATARWLADLDEVLYAKLAAVDLVKPRETKVMTLVALLDRFVDTATVKPSTRAAYRQTTGSLRENFGGNTPLRDLTPADADAWRKAIADSGLAPATVAKRVHVARAIFRKAVKWGWIATSPFAELRAGSQCNPDRMHYVSAETIEASLEACPDDEWRAIIALVRYAGLRCPSEVFGLKWGDVNWDKSRLTVRSPKTAGHGDGHAVRVVPIAPALRPTLLALFDAAPEGATFIIGERYRKGCGNLGTHFRRIIQRAGLKPWPRLFHNLRASCACDWCERFPAHVVAGWLGHSPLIAARHYLQTRDTHFSAAAGLDEVGAQAAQNQAQKAHETLRNEPKSSKGNNTKTPAKTGVCGQIQKPSDPFIKGGVGDTGLEPVTSRV